MVYSDISEKQKRATILRRLYALLGRDRQGEALTLSNVAYNEREQEV